MKSLLDLAVRGPLAVGVRTLELPSANDPSRTLPTDLWYPAVSDSSDDGHHAAPHPLHRPHLATVDADALSGSFPLVVFSHGNSGLRQQSTFLTTHLASWGIGVVAPDHTGNTFPEMAKLRGEDERKRVHLEARANRPYDARIALDAALANRFEATAFDPDRVGAIGHSFGGWTATKLPTLDERIRAVCALAPASEAFVGRKAYAEGELPLPRSIASLIIAGVDDVLVDLETSVLPLAARLRAPTALVGIEAADHFHFCDGIELLHGLHVANPRANAHRPTLPYAQTLDEVRSHRILRALATSFFMQSFADEGTTPALSGAALTELDSAAVLLDAPH